MNIIVTINNIKYFASADESIISKVNILFNAVKSIPSNDVKNGYKLEIGFTVFIFLTERDGYKQRYTDLGGNASGWCIESISKRKDGSFYTIETKEYIKIYAYQLLQSRPELIKILVLPHKYFVVINDETVIEILNKKDESVIDK